MPGRGVHGNVRVVGDGRALHGGGRAEAPSYLNPALVQVGQVPGQIVDVSETQILYLDRSASQVMLKVLDRATQQTVTVPAVPDGNPVYGWLVPGGVIFRAQGTNVTTARLMNGMAVRMSPISDRLTRQTRLWFERRT